MFRQRSLALYRVGIAALAEVAAKLFLVDTAEPDDL